MGNALTVYSKVSDPIRAAKDMANAVASIVANTTRDQGEAIALVCLCDGIHPLDFVRRYHWIPGKGPSMRADAMLGEFSMNQSGSHEMLEKSPRRAAIRFKLQNGSVRDIELTRRQLLLSRWPWQKQDAKAGTIGWRAAVAEVYKLIAEGRGDDEIFIAMLPQFKDNYGTETDWQNMLWARLVSDSIRSLCPQVNAGLYTPEELDSSEVEGEVVEKTTRRKPRASEIVAAASEAAAALAAETVAAESPAVNATTEAVDGEVVDAEFVVTTPDEVAGNVPAAVDTPPPCDSAAVYATRAQLDRIVELRSTINLSDVAFAAALAKRNVRAAASLTIDQAQEIIDKMAIKAAELATAKN